MNTEERENHTGSFTSKEKTASKFFCSSTSFSVYIIIGRTQLRKERLLEIKKKYKRSSALK